MDGMQPPKPKRRSKKAKPSDDMVRAMGSRQKALDAEEFPRAVPRNLDPDEEKHYVELRDCTLLLSQNPTNPQTGKAHTHPRSLGSRLGRARSALRMLQQRSQGLRAKFEIRNKRVVYPTSSAPVQRQPTLYEQAISYQSRTTEERVAFYLACWEAGNDF
ncbi:hypothetical protein MMC28_005539 [Mycoblastus sanguinarius]|nr:hypothetical protein [Mycoblastus sanguinarius]